MTVIKKEKIVDLHIDDLRKMSLPELESWFEENEIQRLKIKEKLGEAKSQAVIGRYSDPVWYRKTESRLTSLSWLRNEAQKLLGDLRRKERVAASQKEHEDFMQNRGREFQEGRAYSMIFMRCAKDFLPKDLYEELQRITNTEFNRREKAISSGVLLDGPLCR